MRVSEIELRIRCNIGLKELKKRGRSIRLSSSLNKMSRNQLVGVWGNLKQHLEFIEV